jgi:hypothetical protein
LISLAWTVDPLRVREPEAELIVLHPSFWGSKSGMFNVPINIVFLDNTTHDQ